jgi:class 3 adenylate cyclase/DNA-binding CsgD family transcriptional regulator
LPWLDSGPLLDGVEEFLTGARPTPVTDRVLATLLFTHLVGSTETIRRLGDAVWWRLLERLHAAERREIERFAGEFIDTAGEGVFAIFDGPGRAIRCAQAIREEASTLGLEIRAGIHTGEVERPRSTPPSGIAVHVAARVASLAGPGEILVSATTRDLVAGSGLSLDERGDFEMQGLGERRRVYALSGRQSAQRVRGGAARAGREKDWAGRLTRRELEIARLVAEGLTNREIASRSFISVRTAEYHVEQIRNKLGFNSRSQIAAWFATQDR